MKIELENILDETLASAEGKNIISTQDYIKHCQPFYDKVKDVIPNMESFQQVLHERWKLKMKEFCDMDQMMPFVSEAINDLFKVPEATISAEFMIEFLKPYHERAKEYCHDYQFFYEFTKQYFKTYYMQPKNDLMSVIKECNRYFKELAEKAKSEGRDYVLPDGELTQLFKPYHERVISECPDINYFMHLCSLDLQYNFIGGAVINKEGSTTVNIQ